MSSTYSTNLALELIGTGDQAGTWGATTNTNLGTLIEQAISGYVTQAVATGTDTTITIPNGITGVARNMFIELTGTGGTNTNLIVPSNKKLYFIYNNSTGAVTVKVSGQTGVSVPAAAKILLVCNGTDIVLATNYMLSPILASATLTSPTLSSAVLGTPTSGTLTNCTGLPLTTGVSGILGVSNGGTGVTTSTGSGANVLSTSPTLVTPLLGTPTSGNLTNCTNLPISTGVSGLGPGMANFLATPSSANLASVVSDETGSGALVFATSPTLVTPALGIPSSGTLTNCTSLPIAAGTTGTLPVTRGGTGTTTVTGLVYGNGTGAFTAASPGEVVAVIGTTPVTNASKLTTTNFTIEESGGKLLFKYGGTTIASMTSAGVLTTLSDITAGGTP